MALSPSSTASSSELYAPSEPIEEQDPGQSVKHESPQAQRSTAFQRMPSPTTTIGTVMNGRIQYEDDRLRVDEISEKQADVHPKRKRKDDPETFCAVPTQCGNLGPHPQNGYLARHEHQTPHDEFRSSSGNKRIRMNGFSPSKADHTELPVRPATLPAELWHHVFRFVPPVFLGRLLRVNHAFRSYLTSSCTEPIPVKSFVRSGVQPLDAESIWTASRKRFAPGLPKPLRNFKELDMWRLLRGRACQLCGQAKDLGAMSSNGNPWESGPDLLLSSDCPSFLLRALPFALVSKSLHYIPNNLLRESTVPPSLEMVKRYYKLHVQNIRQQLDDVRELGIASADEWSKGLAEEGKERINDAIRWEQWEAKGGLKKVNMRPQAKVTTPMIVSTNPPTLPQKPQIDMHSEVWASQQVLIDPRYNGQISNGFVSAVESYQYPHSATAAYQPSWTNPGSFQEVPAHQPPPSMPVPRPERNMKGANEAKAARRAEIERRCSLFDPPLLPHILNHMESFQAAMQITTPLTDLAWNVLKPRLVAQRAGAEKREQELVQQNELLQSENRQRRQQDTQPKDSREMNDRHFDSAQAPIRDRLGALADAVIDERWYGGRAVTKENSPKFASDVLLCVRQRFYEAMTNTNGAATFTGQSVDNVLPKRAPSQKLILENMKWVFDTKIKPFTEHFQKELFLCNGCDDNFKFYGFEGVIQHYAAKHTTSLSQGSIVVYWRAEWPDEPPFNPEPSLSKSAYYKVPSPASAGPNLYNHIDHQLFNSEDRYGAPAETDPQPATDEHSNIQNIPSYHNVQSAPHHDTSYQYPYNPGYLPVSSSVIPPNGASNGFAQTPPSDCLQQWQGNNASTVSAQGEQAQKPRPQYTGYDHPATFTSHAAAPSASYSTRAPIRPAASHPLHFDPSRNNATQFTEDYRQQMDEMAKQARDVWFSTSGIKDLPASVRIYVVIHHMASRCSAKFFAVPSLAMFLDGLDNNAQMRPVRSLNGLACKLCVTQHNPSHIANPQSQPPASDRKLFTLPHLLNHFRNLHLEGSEAFAHPSSGPDGPQHDWTRDMIELPETRLIANLVYSPGMDDNKLDLIAWAFSHVFPLPLPSLGLLRSSGVLRSTGPVPLLEECSSLRAGHPTGPPELSLFPPTTSKGRTDEKTYDRDPGIFRPVSELSRPSEPPGEDEYDPHKPAYQGRHDVWTISPEQPQEKSGWQDRFHDRQMPETTDLSQLIFNATQMQSGLGERKRPEYPNEWPRHLQSAEPSSRYYDPQKPATNESISKYGSNGLITPAHDENFQEGQLPERYISQQREVESPRNRVRSPSASAGIRAAEQFLQHFNQAPEVRDDHGPGSFEQHQAPSLVHQWSGGTEMRIPDGERIYQANSTNPMSYRPAQLAQEVSPRAETHASRSLLKVDRDTSSTHFQPSVMYQHVNYQRSASNALVNTKDPEMDELGARGYVDYPTPQRTTIQDRPSRNGYGVERPGSGVDGFRPPQEAYYTDRPRSSVPIDTIYYHSRSPVEDPQAQAVYRVRSPQQRKPVQRISYGYPSQDRHEVLQEQDYAHNPQVQYQPRVEYVPVRVGDPRPGESSRYTVAQPLDRGGRADYVRLEEAYAAGTVYEHDGQLYRTEPRTYRTPVIRGNTDVTPSYSY
ncbi:MAG: hypothetical protein Q9186_001013 [Xanthomendoza sp. 1 TL-2023]